MVNFIVSWYPTNRSIQFQRSKGEIKFIAGKTLTETALNKTEWKEMEKEAFAKFGQTYPVLASLIRETH